MLKKLLNYPTFVAWIGENPETPKQIKMIKYSLPRKKNSNVYLKKITSNPKDKSTEQEKMQINLIIWNVMLFFFYCPIYVCIESKNIWTSPPNVYPDYAHVTQ